MLVYLEKATSSIMVVNEVVYMLCRYEGSF